MKHPVCSRMWEAEAIGDDRLDPTARASFERHAVHCEACSKELRQLARVLEATRELPEYPSQAIDRRRSRIALLQRANEHLMRGRGPRVGVLASAAVTACGVVLAVLATRGPAVRPPLPAPTAAPTFEIVDVNQANWTTATAAGTVRIALSGGTAAIHVQHLLRDQRFVLELPDGNLEVRGTRFQVRVEGQRTRHLEVSEGVVALRLVREPEIVLVAGQQWTAQETVAAASAPTSSLELPTAGAQPPPPLAHSRSMAAPVSPPLAPAAAPLSPSPAADTSAPGENLPVAGVLPIADSYGPCIRAFQSGDYAGADRLLAAFVRDNPADARSEDAAFLRAVSHARMGDASGAASLAQDYLQRYPRGLRHREAERLAGSGAPSRPPVTP